MIEKVRLNIFRQIYPNQLNFNTTEINIESSTNSIFNDAAIEAAKKTRWKPMTENGKPSDCWLSIPIVFQLGVNKK